LPDSGIAIGWQWENPSPVAKVLSDVWVGQSNQIRIVGYDDHFLSSEDGGGTWESRIANCNCDLFAIDFIDENRGWAVGTFGSIVKTEDGGRNWSRAGSFETNTVLRDILFINDSVGFIAGSRVGIYRTFNGGLTWDTLELDLGVSKELIEINFINDTVGWMSGSNGMVIATRDGGISWTKHDYGSGVFWSLSFINDSVGYIGNLQGQVLKSSDAGRTWRIIYRAPEWVRAIHFFTEEHGWIAGENGLLGYTDDGGLTWTFAPKIVGTHFNSFFLGRDSTLWLSGYGGLIYRLEKGSISWESLTKGVHVDLYGVGFADQNRGYVTGDQGNIVTTADGGKTWNEQTSGTDQVLFDVEVGRRGEAWVSGGSGTILHTTNWGSSWQKQTSGTLAALYRIEFANDTLGWAGGTSGELLETKDGGAHWNLLMQLPGTIWCLHVAPDKSVWASGYGFIKRRDTLGNWIDITSLPVDVSFVEFMHVQFISDSVGIVIIPPAFLYSTNDGGATWSEGYTQLAGAYLTGRLIDKEHAWMVGDQYLGSRPPMMYRTGNSLTDMIRVDPRHNNSINGIFFIDDKNGWIVGDNGMILHTTNGGIEE
jgi:photosystem II stability/assembly factor-like uncharacterized protein